MNVTEVLQNVVRAWEATKSGETSVREIQRWLIEDMKPAVDAAREALASPVGQAEGRSVCNCPSLDNCDGSCAPYLGGAEAEPVAWRVRSSNFPDEYFCSEAEADQWANSPGVFDSGVTPLYALSTSPAPATGWQFRDHLQRQREWSEKTFGPGPRTKGVVDHIRKELNEIEADPADILEWIDVAILALDGAWRAGFTPDQIIEALIAKQTRNEGRTWPDWRTASPDHAIEHVRLPTAGASS